MIDRRDGKRNLSGNAYNKFKTENPDITLGFARTCTCPTNETRPGTVLDPFMGSGTTGVVAQELGRHFVGIEVSETYIQIAEQRLRLPPEKRSVAPKELDVTDLPLFMENE